MEGPPPPWRNSSLPCYYRQDSKDESAEGPAPPTTLRTSHEPGGTPPSPYYHRQDSKDKSAEGPAPAPPTTLRASHTPGGTPSSPLLQAGPAPAPPGIPGLPPNLRGISPTAPSPGYLQSRPSSSTTASRPSYSFYPWPTSHPTSSSSSPPRGPPLKTPASGCQAKVYIVFNRIPIENLPETSPETPNKTLPETLQETPSSKTYESVDSDPHSCPSSL